MDGPTRMVTWSLSLTSNMFPLTDAHKSIICATSYGVHCTSYSTLKTAMYVILQDSLEIIHKKRF